LSAAETAIWFLSTLHTVNAGENASIVSWVCLIGKQEQMRIRFPTPALGGEAQRLAPKIGGRTELARAGNHGRKLRTQEALRLGETEGQNFFMRSSRPAILRLAQF